jgi:hypothetical protein
MQHEAFHQRTALPLIPPQHVNKTESNGAIKITERHQIADGKSPAPSKNQPAIHPK